MPLVVCVCRNRYERVRDGERERGERHTHTHTYRNRDTHTETHCCFRSIESQRGRDEGARKRERIVRVWRRERR